MGMTALRGDAQASFPESRHASATAPTCTMSASAVLRSCTTKAGASVATSASISSTSCDWVGSCKQ